jgi:V8-like Glu-specific endopeptidase
MTATKPRPRAASRKHPRAALRAALLLLWAAALGGGGCGGEHPDPWSAAERPVVYGADDRREYDEIGGDRELRRWADATGLLAYSWGVSCSGGTCSITTSDKVQLCSKELYAGQKQADSGECTTFLVGPDLLVTAGHCIDAKTCPAFSVVFGFIADKSGQPVTSVPARNVYTCKEVLHSVDSGTDDYAVFRVDRTVVDRAPLPIRHARKVADGQELVMIGHPKAMPLKWDDGGEVKENTATNYFKANLDAFKGNSGSPVINAETGVVEGLLVNGNTDFNYNAKDKCNQVNVCLDSGCSTAKKYERVTRILRAEPYIPLHPAGIHATIAPLHLSSS